MSVRSKESYSRKVGVPIWEGRKDPVEKKNYPKGQHGPSQVVKRRSPYGKQLVEKQRLRAHYAMEEQQLLLLVKKAQDMHGSIVDNIANLLESRLPTVVYRSGLAKTIFLAKQMVSHGHILVNGKKIDINSYHVKIGDVVELKSSYHTNPLVLESVTQTSRRVPDYVEVDKDKFQVKLVRNLGFTEIPFPKDVKINLIVGFYSRKI